MICVCCLINSAIGWSGSLRDEGKRFAKYFCPNIEVFLNNRAEKHHNALRVWAVDTLHPQEEHLYCLWAQIRKLHAYNWTEKHIPRPYLAFDRMFDYTDCPDGPNLPEAHSIERFLIEEHLHHIIYTHHLERKDCAVQLPLQKQNPIGVLHC